MPLIKTRGIDSVIFDIGGVLTNVNHRQILDETGIGRSSKEREAWDNISILSNHSSEWAWPSIRNLRLHELCNPIVISAEVGLAKPDIAIFEYILGLLKRESSRCLFIDDKEENLLPARQLGMRVLHFTGGDGLRTILKEYGIHTSISM